MNSKEYYSKFIALQRDMTKLIELHQDTRFTVFVQDINSISQLLCIIHSYMLRWRSVLLTFLTCGELLKSFSYSGSTP